MQNSFMSQLGKALQSGNVTYTGGSAKNVEINLGKGDADIDVRGQNVQITTGTGDQRVQVLGGTDVTIKLDQNPDADWDYKEDWDSVAVVTDVHKGKVDIDMGHGDGIALAVGHDIKVNYGDGGNYSQNTVVWGDKTSNADITYGNGGRTYTSTLDKAAANGAWEILEQQFIGEGKNSNAVLDAAVQALQETTISSGVYLDSQTYNAGLSTNNKTEFMQQVQAKYNLDAKNLAKLEQLYDSGELFAEFKPGVPLYVIVQSGSRDSNGDGQNDFVLAKVDSYRDSDGYIHAWGYGYDSNGSKKPVDDFKDCIRTENAGEGYTTLTTAQRFTKTDINAYDQVWKQDYTYEGSGQIKITGGQNISNFVDITVSNANDKAKKLITFGDVKEKNIINVGGAYIFKSDVDKKTIYDRKDTNWDTLQQTGKTVKSPIVIDFNKDGKVSAQAGIGVDINGDGIADGAATGGDKMLAMSDMNGNGQVDGTEVFGDETVNPFTKQKINAANGFEALKVIAQDAEKYAGVKCYNNGKVDLQALKQALATVGVNLGFVSDNNITELEELSGITALDVDNYTEHDETGAVQHRQQGVYYDENGQIQKADDVWFETDNLDFDFDINKRIKK